MEDKKQKLKPCPFCGGEAFFVTSKNLSSHHGVGFEFEIKCGGCKVELNKLYRLDFVLSESGEINILNDERSQAVKNWNRRC